MDTDRPFTAAGRLRSVRYAVAGIAYMLRTQHNAWLHAAASLAVVVVGLALGVSAADWRWLIAAMALVWIAEAMNTAFEHLCDVVSPEFHASVQKSKDVAAGAVLLAAIAAAAIGASVLVPYLGAR